MDEPRAPVVANPWQQLRQFTPARIALGRAGISLPTRPNLEFQFAHARARDAVHHPLAIEPLQAELANRRLEALVLHSAAADRTTYLQRPDLGRRLATDSRCRLEALASKSPHGFDVAFVIADGLSAFAIEENAISFLDEMLAKLKADNWRVAPIAIVEQGRVAIGDEVGLVLKAEMVAILIGERPGLSSPDSMGIYLTFEPRVGRTDAERNCISNVRREGISHELAAHKLHYLMTEARRRRITGVSLKDESESPRALPAGNNFLISST
ncbi:MAG: ethanolamine ammonia-lyase subunit EutC [Pirellulales bacterium]